MFGASETTLPFANQYLGIYLLGTVSVQVALGLNQFISCQGFAKTSMMTVLIGAVSNIILDPILIFGLFGFPRLEVAGAAIATVTGQIVAVTLSVYFNCTKKQRTESEYERIPPG